MVALRMLETESAKTLPNAVREAMLAAGAGKSLLVAELLYCVGVSSEVWLTRSQIERIARDNAGMSTKTVIAGLQDKTVFDRRNVSTSRGAGRPTLEYRVPTVTELEAEYAPGVQSPSDPITPADCKNLKTYRMALHHRMARRLWVESNGRGFRMSRGLMAARLAVTTKTIIAYDYELGHTAEKNLLEREITEQNWSSLPRFRSKNELAGRRWLQVRDWRTGQVDDMPRVRYLAYKGVFSGKQVFEVEQQINTYHPFPMPDKRDYGSGFGTAWYIAWQSAAENAGFRHQENGWIDELIPKISPRPYSYKDSTKESYRQGEKKGINYSEPSLELFSVNQ